jgi:hypothetical protein
MDCRAKLGNDAENLGNCRLTPRPPHPDHNAGVPQRQPGDRAEECAPQPVAPPRDGAEQRAENKARRTDEQGDLGPIEGAPIQADIGHASVSLWRRALVSRRGCRNPRSFLSSGIARGLANTAFVPAKPT